MNHRIVFCVLLIVSFGCFGVQAQLPDCTLGLGGKDTEVLSQVFQLNDEQLNSMELLIGELQTGNKVLEDQIKELLNNHPQSTEEELITLAEKYKVLKDQMVAMSITYDRKLLGLFNERQYQRYVSLCKEAFRQPLVPLGSVEAQVNPE
ncbi:MAG TPA: hypothetical protein VKN36_15210 [Eudoraea sp.]|nr:hypothetical protein [Eudoraea sp.]